jgi:protein-disulfide isomerase
LPGGGTGFIGTGGGGGSGTGGGGGSGSGVKPALNASDHILGSSSAPVTVIEYADFQCPACGLFDRNTWPTIKANYVDTGKIRYVFRHLPLRTIHAYAEWAAQASECAADQVEFFALKDLAFADRLDLLPSGLSREQINAMFAPHVAALGGSSSSFTTCATGFTKASRVQQDVDSATTLGVSSTPTFFVEDERFSGALSVDQFSAVLDRHLGS